MYVVCLCVVVVVVCCVLCVVVTVKSSHLLLSLGGAFKSEGRERRFLDIISNEQRTGEFLSALILVSIL